MLYCFYSNSEIIKTEIQEESPLQESVAPEPATKLWYVPDEFVTTSLQTLLFSLIQMSQLVIVNLYSVK